MTQTTSTVAVPEHRRTSGMAVTALVLGILGVVAGCAIVGVLPALAGVILGIVALMQIARPESGRKGKGFAIAGIATGGAGVLLSALAVILLFPALEGARDAARQTQEASQLRQLALGVMMYAADHNDQLPPHAERLIDAGYVTPDLFASPHNTAQPTPTTAAQLTAIDPPGSPVYRYGDFLWLRHSGRMSQIGSPSTTPLAISAVPSPKTGRRGVIFADGHVQIVEAADLPTVLGPVWSQLDLAALDADGP